MLFCSSGGGPEGSDDAEPTVSDVYALTAQIMFPESAKILLRTRIF